MSSIIVPSRRAFGVQCQRLVSQTTPWTLRRALSTLPNNPHIYIHEESQAGSSRYILSYSEKSPPIRSLAIGTTTKNPPTPESFKQNDDFLKIVNWAIKDHAIDDPEVQAQAAMYASQAGAQLGSGGAFFREHASGYGRQRGKKSSGGGGGGGGVGGDGAGGASSQGGMGGAGRGGFVHVSDQRNPPDFGRIAWPEDIFGSLEVDGEGKFVSPKGRYQESGTYRTCTNEGILGLSPYLREKVVERVRELDAQARKNA